MSPIFEYGWHDATNGRNYLLVREGNDIGFRRDGDREWDRPEDDFAIAREFEQLVKEIGRRDLASLDSR